MHWNLPSSANYWVSYVSNEAFSLLFSVFFQKVRFIFQVFQKLTFTVFGVKLEWNKFISVQTFEIFNTCMYVYGSEWINFLLRIDTPYLDAKSLEEIYIGFLLCSYVSKFPRNCLDVFYAKLYYSNIAFISMTSLLTHTVAHSTRPLGLKPIICPFLCHMILYSCYLNMWTVKHLAPAFWTESQTCPHK